MPICASIVHSLSSNIKKYFLPATFYLLLSTSLSGCSLLGSQKPAALQVSSVPEASVFLDGKHLGKTPFYSDQLPSGIHTIKITASEASYVQKINLYPQALTVVNRELNDNFMAQSGEVLWLENGKNDIFINSSPQDAEITIDGKFKGKAPLLVTDTNPGEHKVTIIKTGYVQREFSIKSSSKYQLIADVTLASEIAKDIKNINQEQSPQTKKLEILTTPQGYLKVRKEPSLDSTEVGRVNSGDQLEIIQETEDWVKISSQGKLGWISVKYTKKL